MNLASESSRESTQSSGGVSYYKWALVFIAFLFLLIRLPFITKEYAPEEAAWVRAGQGVEQTGFPWTYVGEQSPGAWAYWKGPLFPWLLGASYKIYGESEAASRSVPLIFSLGQIILIYLLARRIFNTDIGGKIGLLAAFLITINPLAIQNSLQIDIDGSMVAFFALLIIYSAWPLFAAEKNRTSKQFWYLFFASLALFLARFDLSLMLYFSIMAFAVISREYKLAKSLLLLFLAAIIAAILIFALYNGAFGQLQKTIDPFANLAGQLSGTMLSRLGIPIKLAPSVTEGVGSRLYDVFPGFKGKPLAPIATALFPTAALLTVVFVWITIPLVALLIFSLFLLIKRKAFLKKEVGFLLLPAAIIFACFIIVAPSFSYPRYLHTSLVLFTILLSYVLLEYYESLKIYWSNISEFLIAGGIVAAFFILKLSPLGGLLFDDRVRANPLFAGFALLATVVLTLVFAVILKQPRSIAVFLCTLLVLYLSFSGAIISKDLRKPYSLNAYYGNYGFKEAGEFLKSAAYKNSVVVTVDTAGYYYGRPYYDINLYNPKTMPKADFIAAYRVPPARFANLIDDNKKIASFGTVEIYSTKK